MAVAVAVADWGLPHLELRPKVSTQKDTVKRQRSRIGRHQAYLTLKHKL